MNYYNLLLTSYLVLVVTGQQNSQTTSAEFVDLAVATLKTTGVEVGDKAPSFQLKDLYGKEHSFDNTKDSNGNSPKGYILIFTCNTCPYAQASEKRIIDLHKKYAPLGYPVIAIQPNDPDRQPGDNLDAMKKRAKKMEYPFPYLLDDGQEVYPKYGATRTPEVYLVDKDRIVRYHGAIDDSVRDPENVKEKFLENAIDALENGKTPSPVNTKAIGCSIKAA